MPRYSAKFTLLMVGLAAAASLTLFHLYRQSSMSDLYMPWSTASRDEKVARKPINWQPNSIEPSAWSIASLTALSSGLQAHLGAGLDLNSSELHPNKISGSIMPAMGNTTIRAELGAATWRLLHTMASRFPKEPTQVEQLSFEVFVTLLSRLYPCGNCAHEFQQIIKDHPPKLDSRDSAVQWMCQVHNIVNKRLGKKLFDCKLALEAWKCGCADQYL